MENPQTKRQMYQPLTPQNTNPDIAALSTIGMRIRKSIMDGHPGNSQYSYNPQFGTQSASSQPTPLYQRTPLPAHMSQPPSLTNEGSTFQSGLNVSEWGAPNVHVTTLPLMGTKRKFSDEPEQDDGYSDFKQFGGYGANNGRVSSFGSWEEFTQRNGALKFDEDFWKVCSHLSLEQARALAHGFSVLSVVTFAISF